MLAKSRLSRFYKQPVVLHVSPPVPLPPPLPRPSQVGKMTAAVTAEALLLARSNLSKPVKQAGELVD